LEEFQENSTVLGKLAFGGIPLQSFPQFTTAHINIIIFCFDFLKQDKKLQDKTRKTIIKIS